jgi:hypothetical protein
LLGDDEALWLEEYAPALFGECRSLFNISEDSYKRSVSRTGFSFIEFASNSKSGEMFFFSWDGKYIIKTISDKEVYVLLKMLPKYLQHVAKPSLLMRICGLYRVSVSEDFAPRFFLIAISVFDVGELGLHHQFDLKGSTHGRLAKPEESVHKDLNWIKDDFEVNLPAGLRRNIAAVLENDAVFLQSQSVLDYSVLVGIHDRHSKEAGKQNKGVRLLQGIVKQKLIPGLKRMMSMNKSSSSTSLPGLALGTSPAEFAETPGWKPATSPLSLSPETPVAQQPLQPPLRRLSTMESGGDMDWLNSLNSNDGPQHIKWGRLPSDGFSEERSISRLPSCLSDPYDEEDEEDWDDDHDLIFPAVDVGQVC